MKKVDIVIGIPSYNESKTIANVTGQINGGVQKYFKDYNVLIVNADNNSSDKTSEIFLKTKTKTPKVAILTKRKGKGTNIYNIFKKARNLKAKAVMITDSDLKSIHPEWVKCLVGSVLNGCDFIAPVYKRDKSDGSITKHICYPLIYGLLGYKIHQPIGGEFGFSKKFINYLLRQKWDKNTYLFGVDVFMSLNAIKGGFNVCEVSLGVKSHKPSVPNLEHMFYEVVTEFFGFLSKNKRLWEKDLMPVKEIKDVCRASHIKRRYFRKIKIIKQKKEIFYKEWVGILYNSFYEYDKAKNKIKVLKKLYPLFISRMLTYVKNTKTINEKEDERVINQQAHYFYKNRNYLLKKYKT